MKNGRGEEDGQRRRSPGSRSSSNGSQGVRKDKRRERDYNTGFACCSETPDDEGLTVFGWLITSLSLLVIVLTLPFSICVCLKVVQEYERAVIFR
jgi:hypothetical protein